MSDDWTKDPSLGGFGNPNLPVPPIAPESGTVLAPPSPGSSTVPNWAFGGSGGRSRPHLPRSPKSLAIALVLVLVVAAAHSTLPNVISTGVPPLSLGARCLRAGPRSGETSLRCQLNHRLS